MKLQMKLNYNGFIEHIADVLAAEDIETVQNEAWSMFESSVISSGSKTVQSEEQLFEPFDTNL